MDELARLQELEVTLDGRRVLDGIDLALRPGASIGVVGPNGSGKTTLLRTLATLVRPTGGEAQVLGSDLSKVPDRSVRSRIGLVSHIPGLFEELTLRENLVHFARLTGHPEHVVDKAIDVVGLTRSSDRAVSASSFGMKRRAEIAWLLIAKPVLLLLDEARSGLDGDARQLIDVLSDRTLSAGGAVVSVSHETDGLSTGVSEVHELRAGSLEVLR